MFTKATGVVAIVVILAGCSRTPANRQVSEAEFASHALKALPLEDPYAFHKTLSEDRQPLRLDPAARPTASEMAIPSQGWSLVIASDAGPVLRAAAEDFRNHMRATMQVNLELQTKPSLDDWSGIARAVVAGTRDQMPGCGAGLQNRKDYRIAAAGDRVAVCGFDERGAMFALYNLESRFSLREAPFLPRDLDTTRRSHHQVRMVMSGIGWMEWPDLYLSQVAHYGFDAIHASIYANPTGVPGPAPYWDRMKKQDPAQLRDLIRRAARYGLDLYCPIIYQYMGTPESEAGLRKLVRDTVRQFPEIRGYVLLIEGFFYKNYGGWSPRNPRGKQGTLDWAKGWARGVNIVTEECRKLNPAIEVLPWDYNIRFEPEYVDVKRFVVEQYDSYAIPFITFENGKGFERDGERGFLKDYAINEIGPAEVAEAQIAAAKRRRNRAVYAKADTFASWQYGTFPYLPFPHQWHARWEALKKFGIDGALETWSYGFKPNWVAEIRAWHSWSGAPPLEDLLRAVARREFGAGSEERVLEAWDHFSRAIRLVPDTGPNWGTNNAVATPMFFEQPRPRTLTYVHSWANGVISGGLEKLNPAWPYVDSRLILFPDFTNQVNAAERYVRPFSLPVFQKYLRLAAEEMEKGLANYRSAALDAPETKRTGAYREVLLAEQLHRMMRSEHAVLEFEDLRFRLAHMPDAAEKRKTLDRMTALLKEEIARTEASWEAARRDSRLGSQWEQDYIYTPDTIQEKLEVLRETLDSQIPAYRRRNHSL